MFEWWRHRRKNLTVLVHRAKVASYRDVMYIVIKIVNSNKRPLELTHVWFDSGGANRDVHLLWRIPPLPSYLYPSKTWQVEVNPSLVAHIEDPISAVRAMTSDHKIYKGQLSTEKATRR
jgi:hypothetical protein